MRIDISPNPIDDNTTIYIDSDKKDRLYIRLYDQIGRKVVDQFSKLNIGTNNILIECGKLPVGLYNVHIVTLGEVTTKTVFINR